MDNKNKKPEFAPLTYIKLFGDTVDKVQFLSDEELGRLVRRILYYAQTGIAPGPDDLPGNERFVFPFFRCDVDRERISYENKCKTNRANGKKGGRPKKDTGEAQDNQQKPTETQEQDYAQGQDQGHEQGQGQDQDQEQDLPKDHDPAYGQDYGQEYPPADVDVATGKPLMPAVREEPKDLGLPF